MKTEARKLGTENNPDPKIQYFAGFFVGFKIKLGRLRKQNAKEFDFCLTPLVGPSPHNPNQNLKLISKRTRKVMWSEGK